MSLTLMAGESIRGASTILANTWAALQTFNAGLIVNSAAGGIFRPAATNDGIKVAGRAGGASAFLITLATATLTASHVATLPDADITVAGSAAALTSGRVPFVTTGGLLTDATGLTFSSGRILAIGDASNTGVVQINGPAATTRFMGWLTAGSNRWQMRADSTAEGGSNAGSNWSLAAYADDGTTLIDTPLSITRAAGGAITLARPVTCSLATGAGLTVSSTTASAATNNGSAVFGGGIGVAGNSYFGGSITSVTNVCVRTGASIQQTFTSRNEQAVAAGVGTYFQFAGEAAGTAMAAIVSKWDAAANTDANLEFWTRSAGTQAVRLTLSSAGNLSCTGNISGVGLVSVQTASGQSYAQVSDAGTTNRPFAFYFDHTSSGTPAAGFGTTFAMRAKSTTTGTRNQVILDARWVDATDASRKAQGTLYASDATTDRTIITFDSDGSNPRIGFLGAGAVARTSMAAATGTATRTTFDTTTVTTQQLAERVKALIDDLRGYGLEG